MRLDTSGRQRHRSADCPLSGPCLVTGVYASILGLVAVVLLLAVLCVALLRSHAEILRRLDRLGVRLDDEASGAPLTSTRLERRSVEGVGDIVGTSPGGDTVVASPLAGDDPVLVAFLSTTCSSCTMFWEAIDHTHLYLGDIRYRVIVVTLGPSEESPTRAQSLVSGGADVVMSSSAWESFNVPGAPYFTLVDPGSGEIIGEGSAATMSALETFLRDASGDRTWDRARNSRIVDRTDADRERMIDEELRRAGILPGDPSLFPPGDDEDGV